MSLRRPLGWLALASTLATATSAVSQEQRSAPPSAHREPQASWQSTCEDIGGVSPSCPRPALQLGGGQGGFSDPRRSTTAHGSDDAPLSLESLARPGTYLPVGLSVSGAFRDEAPDGLMLGAEASLVSFNEIGPPGAWFGGYLDGGWDFAAEAFRHSLGPQFGIAMLGLDTGYLGQWQSGSYRPGLASRGFITLGWVAVYGRYGRLWGLAGAGDEDVAEFGVLAKIPLLLWERDDRTQEQATTPRPSPVPPPCSTW